MRGCAWCPCPHHGRDHAGAAPRTRPSHPGRDRAHTPTGRLPPWPWRRTARPLGGPPPSAPAGPHRGAPVTDAVIVATARTPIGRAFKGSLKDLRPDDLSVQVV